MQDINLQPLVQEHWTKIFQQPLKIIENGEKELLYRCPKYQAKHEDVPVNNPMQEDIPEHVVAAVISHNPDKAAGMDLINKRSLLAGGVVVLKYLTALVNAMRITGASPDGCKNQLVIFLRKSQAKPASNVDNYRPIALQSCAYKCLQTILTARAMKHLNTHHLINPQQRGFVQHGNSIKHAAAQATVFEHARY